MRPLILPSLRRSRTKVLVNAFTPAASNYRDKSNGEKDYSPRVRNSLSVRPEQSRESELARVLIRPSSSGAAERSVAKLGRIVFFSHVCLCARVRRLGSAAAAYEP